MDVEEKPPVDLATPMDVKATPMDVEATPMDVEATPMEIEGKAAEAWVTPWLTGNLPRSC